MVSGPEFMIIQEAIDFDQEKAWIALYIKMLMDIPNNIIPITELFHFFLNI